MKCHGNNNGNQKNGQHGHGKHMLLMILCCAIPLVLLVLLPNLPIDNRAIKGGLSYAMLLICPLAHILMIIPMFFQKRKDKQNSSVELNETE